MRASEEALAAIEELQLTYVDALDSKDLDAWVATFRKGAAEYYVTQAENLEQNLPLSLLHDDCYERLLDRVAFIRDVWKGVYEDYQTRHFVQRVRVTPNDGGYEVKSNFSVLYTPEGAQTTVLTAGVYLDRVVIDGGRALFAAKRAVLDTPVLPRYIVYPL